MDNGKCDEISYTRLFSGVNFASRSLGSILLLCEWSNRRATALRSIQIHVRHRRHHIHQHSILPFHIFFRLPWNQQTLRGWIYETIFSVISSSLYLHTNMVFLAFFIAICEFHQAFLKYFRALMKKIQTADEKKHIKSLLCDVIHYHVSIKRYFQ